MTGRRVPYVTGCPECDTAPAALAVRSYADAGRRLIADLDTAGYTVPEAGPVLDALDTLEAETETELQPMVDNAHGATHDTAARYQEHATTTRPPEATVPAAPDDPPQRTSDAGAARRAVPISQVTLTPDQISDALRTCPTRETANALLDLCPTAADLRAVATASGKPGLDAVPDADLRAALFAKLAPRRVTTATDPGDPEPPRARPAATETAPAPASPFEGGPRWGLTPDGEKWCDSCNGSECVRCPHNDFDPWEWYPDADPDPARCWFRMCRDCDEAHDVPTNDRVITCPTCSNDAQCVPATEQPHDMAATLARYATTPDQARNLLTRTRLSKSELSDLAYACGVPTLRGATKDDLIDRIATRAPGAEPMVGPYPLTAVHAQGFTPAQMWTGLQEWRNHWQNQAKKAKRRGDHQDAEAALDLVDNPPTSPTGLATAVEDVIGLSLDT